MDGSLGRAACSRTDPMVPGVWLGAYGAPGIHYQACSISWAGASNSNAFVLSSWDESCPDPTGSTSPRGSPRHPTPEEGRWWEGA